MRISDWSSDVCSSDLLCVPARGRVATLHFFDMVGEVRIALRVLGEARLPFGPQTPAPFAETGTEMVCHAVGDQKFLVLRPAVSAFGIGRAACRDRVCQDV